MLGSKQIEISEELKSTFKTLKRGTIQAMILSIGDLGQKVAYVV